MTYDKKVTSGTTSQKQNNIVTQKYLAQRNYFYYFGLMSPVIADVLFLKKHV